MFAKPAIVRIPLDAHRLTARSAMQWDESLPLTAMAFRCSALIATSMASLLR
jgi:hypothetical protein